MANRLKKCKHCKEYEPAADGIQTGAGWFHTYACAATFGNLKAGRQRVAARNKAAKAEKKVDADRKRKFYDSDIKTREAAAKKACHAYIRARDYGKPCICCGRVLGPKYDAGHFWESGNFSFTRYHEDNIHGQSVHCNQYKGGDSGDYERNLRIKIGDERVDWLRANRNKVIKRTADDYKAIEAEYKRKLKGLQSE